MNEPIKIQAVLEIEVDPAEWVQEYGLPASYTLDAVARDAINVLRPRLSDERLVAAGPGAKITAATAKEV